MPMAISTKEPPGSIPNRRAFGAPAMFANRAMPMASRLRIVFVMLRGARRSSDHVILRAEIAGDHSPVIEAGLVLGRIDDRARALLLHDQVRVAVIVDVGCV